MKIRIRDIVSEGIRLTFVVRPVDIGLENEDFIEPDNKITVIADLTRVNEFVLARIKVTFIAENHCARCLDRLTKETSAQYEIDFPLEPGDEWLDMGARVREEMIMGYLPRALCREDCQGICPDCGVDLNTEQCECKKE